MSNITKPCKSVALFSGFKSAPDGQALSASFLLPYLRLIQSPLAMPSWHSDFEFESSASGDAAWCTRVNPIRSVWIMHSPIQNLLRPNSDPTPICCSGEIMTYIQHLSPTFLIVWCFCIDPLKSCSTWKQWNHVWGLIRAKLAKSENIVSIFALHNKGVFLFFFADRLNCKNAWLVSGLALVT